MHKQEKTENHQNTHNHEHLLLFLCFLTSAAIGYILTHQVALLGA